MPLWVKQDSPTKPTTQPHLIVLAVVLLSLVATHADATEYNSRNRYNPDNVASPWSEDIDNQVGIIEQLNSPVPTGLTLVDEDANPVQLGDFFRDGRVVVINLGYSRCPAICTIMRDQLTDKIGEIEPVLGKDYIILNISIDPDETPEVASRMRDQIFEELSDQGVEADPAGWRFLTADQATIAELTAELGYRYMYIEPQNEYGHPGVLVLADGQGVIKRYMSGTNYSPRSLELSIVETSNGVAGNVWDRVFLTCFEWDPAANNYTATAKFMMMGGGLVMLVVLGGLLWFGFSYEKRRRQLLKDQAGDAAMDSAKPA